jgi:hypothetical protein
MEFGIRRNYYITKFEFFKLKKEKKSAICASTYESRNKNVS